MEKPVKRLVPDVDQAEHDRFLEREERRLKLGAWHLKRLGEFPAIPVLPEEEEREGLQAPPPPRSAS